MTSTAAATRAWTRNVAIKVLSAHLATDPQFRLRFEREARAISSLEHPNICTLFDVGEQGDISYLVMPLLDGETLADRLSGPGGHDRALPVREALRIAIEIASAIEAAHEHGIIHRDLKPANIFVLRDGTAKILDFGLAKDSRSTEQRGNARDDDRGADRAWNHPRHRRIHVT